MSDRLFCPFEGIFGTDSLWWENGKRDYSLTSGATLHGPQGGNSLLSLRDTSGYWGWSVGDPDGLWWNVSQMNHALVGGLTDAKLLCGESSLAPNRTASYWTWAVGAKNTHQMHIGGL